MTAIAPSRAIQAVKETVTGRASAESGSAKVSPPVRAAGTGTGRLDRAVLTAPRRRDTSLRLSPGYRGPGHIPRRLRKSLLGDGAPEQHGAHGRDDRGDHPQGRADHAGDREDQPDDGHQPGRSTDLHEPVGALLAGAARGAAGAALEIAHAADPRTMPPARAGRARICRSASSSSRT